MSKGNPVVRFLGWLWRSVDRLMRLLQLLFVLLVLTVLMIGVFGQRVQVPESAALLIDPEGELVEQLSGDPMERALGELRGDGVRQVLVQDLVESLESAAADSRIKAVVLYLDLLDAGGMPKLQAISRAIGKVRNAGKKVFAYGDSFDQWQYYLAAQADEVLLNELGAVYIEGFGYYRTFIRSALDKLRVDLNVFRVGEYKSFVEPFIRDDMSEEDKQAGRQWLQAMWNAYQRDVVAARQLPPDGIDDYANNFAAHVQAAEGSAARAALDRGLVDGLTSRRAFREQMVALVGAMDDDEADFSQIDYRSYLAATRHGNKTGQQVANIGVIVAAGQIVDGEAPPGQVGGDSLAALVRQAAADDAIKAVVLRVDSPGGSMLASEVALDELRRLQESGKPLVVSMGSVAASGGYYISMFADEIWANENTITGSIGVGGLIPTIDRGLGALGVHVDGIGTTRLSGQLRLDRPLGADARQFFDAMIQDAYRVFVGKVAEARHMEFTRADEIARGRVWVGSDAQQLGLVDKLGDLPEAIDAAAGLAGLEAGAYGVLPVEPERSFPVQLLEKWAGPALGQVMRELLPAPATRAALQRVLSTTGRELQALQALNDPRGMYYLCSCIID